MCHTAFVSLLLLILLYNCWMLIICVIFNPPYAMHHLVAPGVNIMKQYLGLLVSAVLALYVGLFRKTGVFLRTQK